MEGFETETHDPAYLMVPQPLPDCYEASAITGSYNPLLPDLPLSLAMMEATDPRIVIFRREDISDHQFALAFQDIPMGPINPGIIEYPSFCSSENEASSDFNFGNLTPPRMFSTEEPVFTPDLSFEPLYAPAQYDASYCYTDLASSPSSSSCVFDAPSSLDSSFITLDATTTPPPSSSAPSPYGPPPCGHPSLYPLVSNPPPPAIQAPTPTAWGFEYQIFAPEPRPSSLTPPPPLITLGTAHPFAPDAWCPPSFEPPFRRTEVFTSRCVQPNRLLGEPLRSHWPGRASKRSRAPSKCGTSSPSTTDGSPVMVPHERPKLLDSVVDSEAVKGPSGKYTCGHIPNGKTVVCGRAFERSEHLKRHWATHTGERPFQCMLCDRKFGRNDNLKQHLKTHDNYNGRNSKLLRARGLQDRNRSIQDVKPDITKLRPKL